MSTHDKSTILYVGGVAMPRPSSYSWGLQDVSNSEAGRTDDMLMHKNRVGQKRKISLSWNGLSLEDTSTVLKAFNPEYITVRYWDMMDGGMRTGTFYVGDRTAPLKIYTTRTKRIETLSFDIIER